MVALGQKYQLSERALQDLWDFSQIFMQWRVKVRLTSTHSLKTFISQQLEDCLSVAPLIQGEQVLDLGTGSGLPGLPLSLADRTKNYTLADRSERRLHFVRFICGQFDLSHVEVLQSSAEQLLGQLWDTVIVRALAPPKQAIAMAAPLLKPTGRLIVMQTKDQRPPANWPTPEIVQQAVPGVSVPHCLWLYDAPLARATAA